jgi:hypothetical protein
MGCDNTSKSGDVSSVILRVACLKLKFCIRSYQLYEEGQVRGATI